MKRPYLLFKRNGVWYYKLPEQSTYHTTELKNRGQAERWVMQQIAEPARERPLLVDFASAFFAWDGEYAARQQAKGRRFGKANAASRQRHLEQYILPAFGKRRMDSLTRPEIENWLLRLKLSNQTKNHILYTFRIVLREALDSGLLAISPLARVEPLGGDSRPRDVFSIAELQKLFPVALEEAWGNKVTGLLFLCLAATGIRSGEARALRWRNVYLPERVALITDTCIGGTTEVAPISTQKGGSKMAILPPRLAGELETWRAKSVWGDPGDLVFPSRERGVPIGAATVSHALPKAMGRLGMDAGGRNLVTHSFRHTWISAARRLLPDEMLRRLTGHHSEAVTNLYDHPQIERMLPAIEPARKVIDDLFG